ncbi:unnamed protein product [Mytilus edulis]|uniref:Ubiquitin-like domain-containing protein n=1 Tax=Mytilus edulis TaxID=6550 RepID=A0A8S3SL41_MYTED|nr:unnamed protein product [Mytilus edulis]
MSCIVCNQEKLSKEFAPDNASDECDHASLTCLRCLVNSVEKNGKCPYPGCCQEIRKNCEQIILFKEILAQMFTKYETTYSPVVDSGSEETFINVIGLTGESTRIKYTPNITIRELKQHIHHTLRIETSKQKLLYEDREMINTSPKGRSATVGDYDIKANATVSMVVCLYSIPEKFNKVVFDLYWGYPYFGRDYLNASCLMYSGTTFYGVCDFANEPHPSIRHSGDIMDNRNRIGHHKIEVCIHNMPSAITHLFFTLSAWKSPNLSKYKRPSLKFYEASRPEVSLGNTTFTHAKHSQAVIMCSMSREGGRWEIYELGKLSAGNVRRYGPLKTSITRLISTGI